MKRVLVVVLGGTLAIASSALAFHDAGVAHCNGCHTMHNSEDGMLVDGDSPNGNPWLLRDATPSDVCLSCHAARHGAVFATDPLVPNTEYGGGDFVFLTEDNLNDGHGGATNAIDGDAAGHNIDAPSRGVGADGTLTSSPGGSFPASILGCTSCHDPHGNENFRLLYGIGGVQDGQFTFTAAAPVADGIANINGAGESFTNHTAYHSGMSAWCGNCHGDFHNNSTQLIHKSGMTMGATVAGIYNLYAGTNNQTGANPTNSYLPMVPFEDPGVTPVSTAGPSASSMVSCVSCHRAHATSGPDMGRWDFNVTLFSEDGVESGAYAIPDPYGDPDNQRSMCNKCHNKDQYDHIPVP